MRLALTSRLFADRVAWMRFLVVGLVLALALSVGPWFGLNALDKGEPWVLLLLVPFVVIMLARVEWSIVLLIIGAVTPPIGIGTGTLSEINPAMILVAALAAAWVVRMLLVEKRIHLVPTAANRPLFVLVAGAVLSMLTIQGLSSAAEVSLPANYLQVQLGGLSLVLLSALAFWLGANLIREARWLKWVVVLIIGLGVAAILDASLIGYSRGIPQTYLFPGVHGLYWMWAPALAYGQILFNRALRTPVKALLGLSIAVWIWWAWIQIGTFIAPLVALFVALAVITWVRSPRLALTGAGLFLTSLVLYWNEYYQRFFVAKLGSYNRPDIWLGMLGSFGGKQPFVGLGPATYSWLAMANGFTYRQSHSQYVDLFLQFGAIGLICFLAFFVLVIRQAWQLRRAWQGQFENGFVVAVLGGLCGALVGSVLADWVLPQVYNVGLSGFRHSMFTWFLAGGLVALSQIRAGQRE